MSVAAAGGAGGKSNQLNQLSFDKFVGCIVNRCPHRPMVCCMDSIVPPSQVPTRTRPSAITQKYSLFKRADIVRKAVLRRIWCLSPLNSKFVNTFNVNQLTPLHAAALLRPGVDAIVLPSRPDVREFFGFVKATTGLQDGQVGGGPGSMALNFLFFRFSTLNPVGDNWAAGCGSVGSRR